MSKVMTFASAGIWNDDEEDDDLSRPKSSRRAAAERDMESAIEESDWGWCEADC